MRILCLPYLYILPSIAILIALAALPGAQVALHTVAALPVGHDLTQRGCRLGILAGAALEDGGCGVLCTGIWRGRADAALCTRLPDAVLHKVTDLQHPGREHQAGSQQCFVNSNMQLTHNLMCSRSEQDSLLEQYSLLEWDSKDNAFDEDYIVILAKQMMRTPELYKKA